MQNNAEHSREEFLVQLGAGLKAIRKSKGISQFDLSVESGLPKTQVGRIERAEINTTIGTLKLITEALDISLSDLFASIEN